jgi:hypothetical protein
MAACKLNLDVSGVLPVVKVPATGLPVACKLQNPPAGVTIVDVEFFPSGSSTATPFAVTGGQSFSVAGLTKGTTGNLWVRIAGPYPLGTTIYVVEDCDSQNRILAVTDQLSKAAYTVLEVD